MGRIKQDLLSKIEAMQKTGAMSTTSGLLQVKNNIAASIEAGNVAMQQYSYNLQVGQERVRAMAEQMKANKSFSKEMTEMSNSPYMLNEEGGIMTDSEGNQIKRDVTKKIQQVIQDNQGNATILYEDGSYSNPIQGIGKKDAPEKDSEWKYTTIEQIDPNTGEKINVPAWVNSTTQEIKSTSGATIQQGNAPTATTGQQTQ